MEMGAPLYIIKVQDIFKNFIPTKMDLKMVILKSLQLMEISLQKGNTSITKNMAIGFIGTTRVKSIVK